MIGFQFCKESKNTIEKKVCQLSKVLIEEAMYHRFQGLGVKRADVTERQQCK